MDSEQALLSHENVEVWDSGEAASKIRARANEPRSRSGK